MPGSAAFGDNLIDSIYADVVDGVRSDLLPEMGIRPYRVFLVTRTWSGGEVGGGEATDVVVEFDPIPRVHNWNDSIVTRLEPCGTIEEGDVIISEMSLSYTHAEIGAGTVEAPGVQVMIRIDEGHGQQTATRFFTHKHAPYIDREQTMGWLMHLRLVH